MGSDGIEMEFANKRHHYHTKKMKKLWQEHQMLGVWIRKYGDKYQSVN